MLSKTLLSFAPFLVTIAAQDITGLSTLVQANPACFSTCSSSALAQTNCRSNPDQGCLCSASYLGGLNNCQLCANQVATGAPQTIINSAVGLENQFTGKSFYFKLSELSL